MLLTSILLATAVAGAPAAAPTTKPAPPPTIEAVEAVEAAPVAEAPPATTTTTTAVDDSARKRPLRIAVYRLESAGVDERKVRVTEASLLEELRKLQRVSVLSLDEVQALLDLEADKQMMGCSESSCLSEIAEALGADALITGGVTQVAETVTVAWKRIDPTAAAVVQTFTRQFTAANGEELLAAVGPGVEALFPEVPLRAGMERGVPPEVAIRLNPPPLPPGVFWSVAGTTGAVAVAAAGAGVLWLTSAQNLESTFATAKTTAVPSQTVLDQQGQVQGSNIAFWSLVAVAGAGAVAAAFIMPFTDWQNFGSEL